MYLFSTDIQPLIIDIIRIVVNKIVGFITNFKCLYPCRVMRVCIYTCLGIK